ncbi:amino acid adenylation domain-containing protein [Kitasatospora sp. NPDC094015]|uniref:non-ribosomal peptide synthetase n=1 Tax=Kitasatospora sp. NPDC094015 TaxID=3155205 RepID=UPI003326714A
MPEQNAARPSVLAGAAQHGVWLTERLGLAGRSYHMPVRTAFERIDPAALTRAWEDVLDRHPALSRVLVEQDGALRLRAATDRPALRTVDATGDGADEFAKRVEADTALPFRLDSGPLVRATLYHRPDGSAELLTVAHHAVFDGISKDLLLADLATAYNARRFDREPGWPGAAESPDAALATALQALADPAPALVEEAAAWYRDRWTDHTEPVLPGLERPGPEGSAARAGAPAPQERRGESIERVLGPVEHRALRAAAEAAGVTVFELLLATTHALLLRYGNEGASIAVPLSTRGPGRPTTIGLHVNELPVPVPPVDQEQVTLAALARAVRAQLRTVYRFRTVPFGAAVRGLTPRVGLTPVTFGYRRRGADPVFEDAAATVDWAVFNQAARTLLNLQVVDEPERAVLSFQYDPQLLPPDAARRIAGHFAVLLDAAVADPDRPLAELPLLGRAEHYAVTTGWNATAAEFPDALTVLDLIDRQAELAPDATAVTAADGSLDHRSLRERSTALAAVLRSRGIGPGSLVAVHLDRTARLPVALLAVLRTGAAYLPLDPAYPAERLAFLLADSGAALLLTDREPAAELAAAAPAVLDLRRPAEPLRDAGPAARPGPADTAYVLYTSGSTGRPKGVAVGHRALVNLLASFADRLDSGPGHAWLGLTSLSFDISALELFLPLTTGGRLVLAPDGLAVDGPGLLRLIEAEGVTHAQATPSGWRVLLAAGAGRTGLTALVGGEALPLPLARELRASVARLLNVYGPTETTIWSTWAEIPAEPHRIGIGRPIANTRAYVLDARLEPVPVGLPGELLLGGEGLALGYLGRPALTAERFVPDPFGPPGSRLYRTGDLVAWAGDGTLDYLGRLDQQVKIRGHRIEPGEIESALLEHPGVAQAAVAVHQGPDGEPRLTGYLVGPATAEELRAHLLRTLPAAMVPARFVTLERLPLTPNGKLDRRALPEPPALDPAALDPAPEAGAGDGDGLTGALCAIWCEVLGLPEVGPEDDLFDLGGHSLTIIRISARIREAFGVEVDFDVFFDTPTVAGIAEAVARLR